MLLAASGGAVFETIASCVGLYATRGALLTAHAELASVAAGERLSARAAIVHRHERGMRLM